MPNLNISLFGRFSIRTGQQELKCLKVQKVQELLCYLLVHRNRAHHRDILADLLWGDIATPRSKGYLRKVLWQLQTAINSIPELSIDRILQVEPEWLQICPSAAIWVDVTEFTSSYNTVKDVHGQDLTVQDFQLLRNTIRLYRGALLEGWYQDWCVYERERFREMYMSMMDKLMGFCETRSEYEAGIEYGQRILLCDRARERTHRRLMRLYYLAGNRTAALRQFRHCEAMLKEELDVEPSESTLALFKQIASDNLDCLPQISSYADIELESTRTGVSESLQRIKQLLVLQTSIQRRLPLEIQDLEEILRRSQ